MVCFVQMTHQWSDLSSWQVIRILIVVLCWIGGVVLGLRSMLWNEVMLNEVNARLPKEERISDPYSGGSWRARRIFALHARFYSDSPTHKKIVREQLLFFACFITAILVIFWDMVRVAFNW